MTTNGQPRIDYTGRDYASLREAMLELAGERLPEWTDRSPNDLGVMLVELFAYLGDALFYHQDRIAAESYLATARERRSVLNLLRLIGYELRPPVAATADLTLYFDKDATGLVDITTGAEFRTGTDASGKAVVFAYVRPTLSIDRGALAPLEAGPDGKQYRVYRALPVVQSDGALTNEVLGSSDGSAGQRYALAQQPVIDDTILVTVDEGGGPKAWTRQSTLLDSHAGDEHYVVRYDANNVAWIELGDDKNGKIPRRGRNNVRASYRVGGGAQGNVQPFAISRAVTSIDKLTLVGNERQASGGADQEVIADAIARAPIQFRSAGRAVTSSDYEAHALAFGVAKARATAPAWNWVTLVVAPAGGGYASDTLKADLRQYFESRRLITSIIDIQDPVYVDLEISGTVTIEPYFLQDQVMQAVREAVRALWSFDRVSFEETLYISKLYEAIEGVEGVAGVDIRIFRRRDQPGAPKLPEGGALIFGPVQIPVLGDLPLIPNGGRK